MLNKKIQNTLTRKVRGPCCVICRERKGLIHFGCVKYAGILCRKCYRDGISRTNYYQ